MLTKRIGAEIIRLYDLEEAAALLGISTRTLREYSYRGLLPCCRLKRKLYFHDKNISAFLRGAASTRRKSIIAAPKYDMTR